MSLDSLILSPSQRASLEEATARYETAIDQRAVSYLTGRGLDQAASLGSRLGLCSDPLPGHERFEGMLSIPYLTPAGVVAIKFRCITDDCDCRASHGGKYDGPAGQKARLYGVESLQDGGDTICIVEGEFSRITMNYMVGVPTVASPGTQWLEHWPRVFADYERILVVADHDVHPNGDSPGIKHAKKVVASLHGAHIVLPPPGLDPDEWVAQDGVEAVRKALGVTV